MLELRPACEHCNTLLLPDSLEARICSYECTFCATCVETVLKSNTCPNCGGGFVQRPVRPSTDWKNGNFFGERPRQHHAEAQAGGFGGLWEVGGGYQRAAA